MRFDYRGMGDSSGAPRSFDTVDDDIRCAVDNFFVQVPSLREVVIWGLCDAASAALIYAASDHRIAGLILLNPWLRSEAGLARVYLRHYYLKRLLDPELWSKLSHGKFDLRGSISSVWQNFRSALGSELQKNGHSDVVVERLPHKTQSIPFADRMLRGLERFAGPVLLILSGNDLTAAEFKQTTQDSLRWRELLARSQVSHCELLDANHTFSQALWRDQVASWTAEWVTSW
jgi:exosortase A-associated hydrolase 1